MLKNEEFLKDFIEESTEHIQRIEEGLLGIEAGDTDGDTLNEVFRAVHSIKGTAGFFGLKNISELSHSMENLLSRMRDGRIKADANVVDALLAGNDTLRSMVNNVQGSRQVDISSIKGQIERILKEDKGLMTRESQAQGASRETGEAGNERKENSKDESLRVSVGLLNDLMDLAGEMVLGRNQLLRNLQDYVKTNPGTQVLLQNIDRITTELQEKVMQTRMQPIANVFNRFPRIIRDMSKALGKEMKLSIEGADVELDKSIIEAIGDPLAHIIRNAADHGIEKADVRAGLGKTTAGLIQMKAYHEGGQVKVEVVDDGSGIDPNRVKEKAINSGLITAREAEEMTEGEVLELIFRPGFSTAREVTDVSGRGVGMDVVKTNIEKLGGVVNIESTPGRGTRFILTLPLTLAIIPSLIVGVGGQRFALPQVNLQEMVRIKRDNPGMRIEHIHSAEVLRLRDRLLPLVRLSDLLGFKDKDADKPTRAGDITRVLVLKAGSRRFGLVVDRVYDSEEILVKPLPRYIKDCRAYSGATILGNGRIALILDPDGIAAEAMLKFPEYRAGEAADSHSTGAGAVGLRRSTVKSLLLFKCGGPELLAVDLYNVSRVEKIKKSDIETIGPRTFIQFRGRPLQVFRPEDILPIIRKDGGEDTAFVIIPKGGHQAMGILVDTILDTVEARVRPDKAGIKSGALAGSAIIDKRIVLIIDIISLISQAEDATFDEGCENPCG